MELECFDLTTCKSGGVPDAKTGSNEALHYNDRRRLQLAAGFSRCSSIETLQCIYLSIYLSE
jgi:hypothetical protein